MNDRVGDSPVIITPEELEALFGALRARDYSIIGPQRRDGAIVYDLLTSAAELPTGWTDTQGPGSYRLERRDDAARFGFRPGATSWKRFLFPPDLRLWRAVKGPGGFTLEPGEQETPRFAFLGVRACELAGIAIQDRVLTGGVHIDASYRARRERAFIVAVACGEPGATCFCASMGSGPELGPGWDLSLHELLDGGPHRLMVTAGSERGMSVLEDLPGRPASPDDRAAASALAERARSRMGRTLEVDGLAERLAAQPEHPQWAKVAARCLSCGNCALSCPTCFCHSIDDTTDLAGESAERRRRWDTCFGLEFSYIHGGSVRPSVRGRYRQWLTHKLSAWHAQFDTPGCVGCGRCITWCPARIDLTEEAAAFRESRSPRGELHAHA